MGRKHGNERAEVELFQRSVGEVTPIRQDSIHPWSSKPAPIPAQRLADDAAVVREMAEGAFFDTGGAGTGEALLYKKPGVQDKVFRKLRRGQFAVSAELDLHGYTVQHARECLSDFLKQSLVRNLRCVRVIHGKGLGSKQGRPTIKSRIGGWLQQRQEVLAFCSARQQDGGAGALYVLLKNRRR